MYLIWIVDILKISKVLKKCVRCIPHKSFGMRKNAESHKSLKTKAKLHELDLALLLFTPYSPNLAFSDILRFSYFIIIFSVNKFSACEEIVN